MGRPLACEHEIGQPHRPLLDIDMVAMSLIAQPAVEDADRAGLVTGLDRDEAPTFDAGKARIGLRHRETMGDLATVEIEHADDRLLMVGEDQAAAQHRMIMSKGGLARAGGRQKQGRSQGG